MLKRYIPLFKNVANNPAILYVISRYGTYAIQFINSIFIAVFLGPYYLGIWGFINLVLGYVGQINFGIYHSVIVISSIDKEKKDYIEKVIANGFSMILILALSICLFFVINSQTNYQIGEKYHFDKFIIPFLIISFFVHINNYFFNIFRVYNKIFPIAVSQSLYPIIILCLIPFFRGENLLWAMVLANCGAYIISFIIFIVQSPIKIHLSFDLGFIKRIQRRGWYLFIYNTSFYLILLSTRAFVSDNYLVKEFGYFTFAFSLANVVLLLMNSLSFLIFPKILNRLSNSNNEKRQEILGNIRSVYISLSHLMIHIAILVFPFFIYLFPQYQDSKKVFGFIALTLILYGNAFGYQGLLMAKNKEKPLSMIALLGLLLNVIILYILVYIIGVNFEYVILATLISYFVYVFVLGFYGRKEIDLENRFILIMKDIYPLRMMLPFILSLVLMFKNAPAIYFLLPLLLYVILNFRDLRKIKSTGQNIINNPELINV